MRRIIAILMLSASCIAPAAAHITLEQKTAAVGAPYKAVFRVPHGCDESPTVRLRVQIPEGVISVKPMVKPGWEIATVRGPYEKAHAYFHGATFSEGVKEVTWSGGKLPNAFYDEFVLSVFIAADLPHGRTLYFPVVQECEKGARHWIEVPRADRPKVEDPAPGVTLIPKN
jgi:Uncharacterized protein conserved in bacteria